MTAPEYADVLRLDFSIRNYPLPNIFDEGTTLSTSVIMQRAALTFCREISAFFSLIILVFRFSDVLMVALRFKLAFMQLHRNFYSHTLSSKIESTMSHPFAPSIIATFRSACKIIDALEQLFQLEPTLSSRFSMFWFSTLSAVVSFMHN
jgi:hypothetical protein